jgi:hypothetical protein
MRVILNCGSVYRPKMLLAGYEGIEECVAWNRTFQLSPWEDDMSFLYTADGLYS